MRWALAGGHITYALYDYERYYDWELGKPGGIGKKGMTIHCLGVGEQVEYLRRAYSFLEWGSRFCLHTF
jgi:hypothetical protein